jgi:hypothetical protein
MHLVKLQIAGWRSYSPALPLVMSDLGRCNVIVGPNNTGKSNLRKFFFWLGDIAQKRGSGLHWDVNFNLEAHLTIGDRWQAGDDELDARLVFSSTPGQIAEAIGAPELKREFLHVHLFTHRAPWGSRLAIEIGPESCHPLVENTSIDAPDADFDQKRVSFHPVLSGSESAPADSTLGALGYALDDLFKKELSPLFICIGPQRHPRSDAVRFAGLDPVAVRQKLRELVSKNAYEWQRLQAWLETELSSLMDVERTRIEVVDDDIRFTFTHFDGTWTPPLTQHDVGTGVFECFLLLVYLRMRPESDAIVFIDEIEAHLHPAAAQRLVRTILTQFPRAQVFLFSNSTGLLDAADESWRLFRFNLDRRGQSVASSLSTKLEQLALLDELGIRPSQLFMAKVTIWVEGPSDVIYLRKMLATTAPSLFEGRDHAFVCYGGSNIRHVSYDDDGGDALVRIFNTCTRAMVICDRDRPSEGDALKPSVDRLLAASQARSECRTLTTDGYEMESMIRPVLLARALGELFNGSERFDPDRIEAGQSLTNNARAALQTPDDEAQVRVLRKVRRSKVVLAKLVCRQGGDVFTHDAARFCESVAEFVRDAEPRAPRD